MQQNGTKYLDGRPPLDPEVGRKVKIQILVRTLQRCISNSIESRMQQHINTSIYSVTHTLDSWGGVRGQNNFIFLR